MTDKPTVESDMTLGDLKRHLADHHGRTALPATRFAQLAESHFDYHVAGEVTVRHQHVAPLRELRSTWPLTGGDVAVLHAILQAFSYAQQQHGGGVAWEHGGDPLRVLVEQLGDSVADLAETLNAAADLDRPMRLGEA